MRDYKIKMSALKLPKERYEELRQFCLNSERNEKITIQTALGNVFGDDGIVPYIYKHVISADYNWAKMEVDCIPCSRDTFRYFRAKFYYELDKVIGANTNDV